MLILPDARCLGKKEVDSLSAYAGSAKTLIITGETGRYDETGARLDSNPVHQLLRIKNSAQKAAGKKFIYYPDCPGRAYYAQLRKEFDQQAAAGVWEQAEFNKLRKAFVGEILEVSVFQPSVQVDASPFLSTQIASVGGKVSVFLANFKGLKSKEIAQQTPEESVTIAFSASGPGTIAVLPFLGQMQELQGTFSGGKLTCKLPPIEKGAAVWVE
jgi:hypothetical protein